ncbi:MAG: hypothetical protein LJE69_08885 [Thiohalocapsa sp.]|jgi:hypothetical protein|uniref:hypothetical protein n=1 Tax=Thiohalocapsa sp. TaxID=2497641 RepID=UPI0025E4D55D|nr:hypothetical protein [Thiohalocapsa sp.]MCG6941353.1 hypothetical protein [Thiohalocapsa sp.]
MTTPSPRLLRLRFLFRADGPLTLTGYAGFAWRGLLGHSLRDLACVTKQPICDGCLLLSSCVYPAVFETPAAALAGVPTTAKDLPHPLVLDAKPVPRTFDPARDQLSLHLTLMGPARAHAPFLIQAVINGTAGGLGGGRTPLGLLRVERERHLGSGDWVCAFDPSAPAPLPPQEFDSPAPALPATPPAATIAFETPLRIKAAGRFVSAEAFHLRDFVRALFVRLQTLNRLYGDGSIHPAPARLQPILDGLQLRSRALRWIDLERWSSRQLAARTNTSPSAGAFWASSATTSAPPSASKMA